ncbi:peptidoglycan-recognition protein 1-like isoform X1 [Macrosteles quadrilineatus]|uniref:peptidoglycan-recognition protein 1-like isoform X1 n=1 Tax=Macrosteles quadrilineatus TaxID=74068 RepID=UPI0023E30AA8|nr:peptidoglycan-recognition protein 1-like isoform X1 [Macrosteles quadrilineatus]
MKYLQRPYIQLVTREDWGAVPPRKKPELLELPAKMLMLFDTQTEECKTTAECKKIVKRLQDEYMNLKGYQDIPWNFLIGADGKAYEGRGWKAKPFKTNLGNAKQAEWDGRSLDVAYIGDYRYDIEEKPDGIYPTNKAIIAVEKLTDHLTRKNIICFQTSGVEDFTYDLEAHTYD